MEKETDRKYETMKKIMDALDDILCSYQGRRRPYMLTWIPLHYSQALWHMARYRCRITGMIMMVTSGKMRKLSGFIRGLSLRQDGVSGSIHK